MSAIFIAMPRKILLKSIPTLLFFVLIGVAFFFLWSKQSNFDSGTGKKLVEKNQSEYTLDAFVVKLAGKYLAVSNVDNGRPPWIGTKNKYLKMVFVLKLKAENIVGELEKKLPQIRVTISDTTSGKSVKDIETVEGKVALQSEIVGKINRILEKEGVCEVLITEFIIQ